MSVQLTTRNVGRRVFIDGIEEEIIEVLSDGGFRIKSEVEAEGIPTRNYSFEDVESAEALVVTVEYDE